MADINISTNVSVTVSEEEQVILQKALNIMENVRHTWFLQSDDCWDSEYYCELEGGCSALQRIFNCKRS